MKTTTTLALIFGVIVLFCGLGMEKDAWTIAGAVMIAGGTVAMALDRRSQSTNR